MVNDGKYNLDKPCSCCRQMDRDNTWSPYCKPCRKVKQADWYQKNKESHKAQVIVRKNRYRKELKEFMLEAKNKPCVDCGVKYPYYVMDFDHLDGEEKYKNVSKLVNNAVSLKKLKKEIAKCELVCANCHRERTFSRRLV